MDYRKAYGLNYKVFWDNDKNQYEARPLGVNVPTVTAPLKEEVIAQMEAQMQVYRIESNKDILPLLKLGRLPALNEIGPIAKARGINTASEFWYFVDEVQKLWREAHSCEEYWDLP